MYLDESSLSLSVLFASHNMIGWYIFIGLWNSMDLYDKMFYTLAYPFVCCMSRLCGSSLFAMIINLLMWTDARNTRGQQGGDGSAA